MIRPSSPCKGILFMGLLLAVLVSGSIHEGFAQSGPQFEPLDRGGLPSNLIGLKPHSLSMGQISPAGSYVIWAATNKPGVSYLNLQWKQYGPYTVTWGKRYVAYYEGDTWGISLADFINAQYSSLKPAEVQINIENRHSEDAFFVINRAAAAPAPSSTKGPGGVSAAGPFLGTWFRTEGGNVVEFLEITQGGQGLDLAFRDRIDGPVTSRAQGQVVRDELKATGPPRLIRMRLTGPDQASYDSTDPGGGNPWSCVWVRSSRGVSAASPFLGTWSRTEGGNVVEFLEITQGGQGFDLAFRDRIDGPVTSRAQGQVVQDELKATGPPRLIRMRLTGPDQASYDSTDPGGGNPWSCVWVRKR